MTPSAIPASAVDPPSAAALPEKAIPKPRHLVDRSFVIPPLEVVGSKGNILTLANGQEVFDATGGAAVACIGHGNQEVKDAIIAQLDINSYCNSMLFSAPACEGLAKEVIEGTNNLMSKVWFCSSGSEATEAALKMARQYFIEKNEPQRTRFIAREHSYHGNTLGALSVSGHLARRAIYLPMLSNNVSWIPPCNAYRQRHEGESDAQFVERKAQELDREFQRVGPENVIAFIAEPISGASLGCVPYVPGYLATMKRICRQYGALVIWDEVMSGMGRCGTLHAWQGDHLSPSPTHPEGQDAVPDLQMVGKGLGGGYASIAGVIVGRDVVEVMSKGEKGGACFVHGQTYQALPLSCAAALKVQQINRRDNLISNCADMGQVLERHLKEKLGAHPHVGDIRGKGLFWGLELVANRETKEPFDVKWDVAGRIRDVALVEESITFYHGQGTVDGINGDHLIVAPGYDITAEEIEMVVDRLVKAIEKTFQAMKAEGKEVSV